MFPTILWTLRSSMHLLTLPISAGIFLISKTTLYRWGAILYFASKAGSVIIVKSAFNTSILFMVYDNNKYINNSKNRSFLPFFVLTNTMTIAMQASISMLFLRFNPFVSLKQANLLRKKDPTFDVCYNILLPFPITEDCNFIPNFKSTVN